MSEEEKPLRAVHAAVDNIALRFGEEDAVTVHCRALAGVADSAATTLLAELQAEREAHARTQGHLDDFQGHVATAALETEMLRQKLESVTAKLPPGDLQAIAGIVDVIGSTSTEARARAVLDRLLAMFERVRAFALTLDPENPDNDPLETIQGAHLANRNAIRLTQHKLDSVAAELMAELAAHRVSKEKLQRVHVPEGGDVWFWQGKGDEPESLAYACSVVMSSDTLKEFVASKADTEMLRAYGVALASEDPERERDCVELETRFTARARELAARHAGEHDDKDAG